MSEKGDVVKQKIDELVTSIKDFLGEDAFSAEAQLTGILIMLKGVVDNIDKTKTESPP